MSSTVFPKRIAAFAAVCLLLLSFQVETGRRNAAQAQAAPVPTTTTGTVTYSAFGPMQEWFTHNIPQRMDRLRIGYGAGPNLALRDGAGLAALLNRDGGSSGKLLLNADGKPDTSGPIAVWITGFGQFGTVDNDGAAPGYTYSLGGFLAGVDYRGANWLIGIHLGYVRSDSNSNDRVTSFDTDSFAIGIHGGARWDGGALGSLYLDGTLTFGIMDTDARIGLGAVVPGGTVAGSFSGLAVGGYLEGGTILNYSGLLVQPMVGLRVVHISNDGFRATGNTATFQIGGADRTSVRSVLGARFSHAFPAAGGRLTLKARAAWMAELADATATTVGTQVGVASSLTLRSNSMGRHFAHLGSALHFQATRSIGVLVDYSATLSSRAVVHAIWGAFRVVW